MLFGAQEPPNSNASDKKQHSSSYVENQTTTTTTRKSIKVRKVTRRRRKSREAVLSTCTIYPSVYKALKFKQKSAVNLTPDTVGRVCVTGVDGFIGAWIVSTLLQRGYFVKGTVQQSENDDINALRLLPNASTHLEIQEASLLTPESCDIAIEKCSYVIHTGTPSSCAVRDSHSEKHHPGVHSIGSRMHCIIPMMTNFIQACARAKIQKLVLTSSIAAMAESGITPPLTISESDWNSKSTLERNPHFLSLKLAEEAAWQLVEQLPKENKFTLLSINLGCVMGPVLCGKTIPVGNLVIFDLISGKYSALVDLNWAMIDVRDAALAHVLALESTAIETSSLRRYIAVSDKVVWLHDIVNILADNGYRGRDLPWKVGLPNWVARLPAYSTQLGQVGASLYAKSKLSSSNFTEEVSSTTTTTTTDSNIMDTPVVFLNSKLKHAFPSIVFTNIKDTIVDSANDLLKFGLIKPWDEDHHAIECAQCKFVFTFYRRKHHCRECGVIICDDCSKSRVIMSSSKSARLCDVCVSNSIPEFIDLLKLEFDEEDENSVANYKKSLVALESLMDNVKNHKLVTRTGGIPLILSALHINDDEISVHAAGTILALSRNVSSSLQMVLEGVVLTMLEVSDTSRAWKVSLQALRNIWRQVNRQDFCQMLKAVARVSTDASVGALKGNIILTFVHMMNREQVAQELLPEGLLPVLLKMLTSSDIYHRCAAAHAIKHLIPVSYNPNMDINVPPYIVDDHNELLNTTGLSDIQFLVKGHIAPINAHKVVLFFRNSFFKNMFSSRDSSGRTTIHIDNTSHTVFSMVLRFLYTGKVDIPSVSVASELLRASTFYQVHELQKRVEHYLGTEVTVNNVVELLHLATECVVADDLVRVCIAFLMKNIHEAVRLDSYRSVRKWISDEVLKELCVILGPDFLKYHLEDLALSGDCDPSIIEDEENDTGCSSPIARNLKVFSPRKKRVHIISEMFDQAHDDNMMTTNQDDLYNDDDDQYDVNNIMSASSRRRSSSGSANRQRRWSDASMSSDDHNSHEGIC